MTLPLFTVNSDADFSPCASCGGEPLRTSICARCGRPAVYRYRLRREAGLRPVNFIMLNPSTADEAENDPTVERCERRARMWGHGTAHLIRGLVVTNLFAFRATDPQAMRAAADPIGPDNDAVILRTAREAGLVVCAWGGHGTFMHRSAAVVSALRAAGVALHYLKLTDGGQPCHPLYLPYKLTPQRWEPTP